MSFGSYPRSKLKSLNGRAGILAPIRQTLANELLVLKNSTDTGNEIQVGIGLQDVARGTNVKSSLDEVGATMLAQEQNLRTRREDANLPRRFKTIHSGQADVHQNHARLQLFGFLYCLQSIGRDGNDLEIALRFEHQ